MISIIIRTGRLNRVGYRPHSSGSLKSKLEFPGLVNLLFSVYLPFLSGKNDISFRNELGSAHVKFDRLNQQSNLIVWVDLNIYIRFGICKVRRLNRALTPLI